jgi:5-methyltetrahydrofolate--homocysteine methyltransferase
LNIDKTIKLSFMEKLKESIKRGQIPAVREALDTLLAEGYQARELLEVMIKSLRAVGEAFSRGEAFIPEMLIAAKATQAGADYLGPRLVEANVPQTGKFMIATVSGDLHDVGKNLVALLFRGNGFEVIDLGVDVSHHKLIGAYETNKPDLIGLSALLTTTMPAMEKSVHELKAIHPEARILVGGAPVTQQFAEKIGADGFALDAASAVEVGRKLMQA